MLYPLSYEGLSGRLPADRPTHGHSSTGVALRRAGSRSPQRNHSQARPHGVEVRDIRRSPLTCCEGATSTGHEAWDRTAWLVEPSRSPEKPPRPREPTTTRSTAVENSARSSAGLPSSA